MGRDVNVFIALLVLFFGLSSVANAAGMEACTRHTPIGIACYCNQAIVSGRQHPGWQQASGMYKPFFVRPGWHVTFLKKKHGVGLQCFRDRLPTPEERAQFLRTGH